MTLTGKQQAKLRIAIISAFPSFTNLEMMLSDKFDTNFQKISNTGKYEEDVFNLIKHFNAKDEIQKLIDTALQTKPGNRELKKFYNYYKSPILEKEIDSLQQILNKIDFNLIKYAYEKTLPNRALIDSKELNNYTCTDEILQILLENFSIINDNPSLIEFAGKVVSKLEINSSKSTEESLEELQYWIESLRKRLGIQEKNRLEIESDFDTNQHYYLFIVFYKNLQDTKKFHLKAELLIHGNKGAKSEPLNLEEILEYFDEEKGIIYNSLEQINADLDKIIEYFLGRIPENDTPNKTIHIFIPYEEWSQNIDVKLLIDDNLGKKVTIIQELNMMVHPLDRFTGIKLFEQLKNGWKRLTDTIQDNPHQDALREKIEFIEQPDNLNWEELTDKLREEKIGLKLTSPLTKNIQDEFLKTLLKGGIPLAFWTRCETPLHLIMLEEIDCHLTVDCLSNNFHKLIENICKIRRQAYNKGEKYRQNYLGYHLGFLCDNPNRKPEILKRLQGFR